MSIFTFLLFLLSYTPFHSKPRAPTPTHNRRTLHQPFFPLASSFPPTQPPSVPPSFASFPKYPFSSSSTPKPFFPVYPSPPPPSPSNPTSSSSSLPTFPANISSIVTPSRHSSPSPSSAKLVTAVAIPLLTVALLGLSAAFVVLLLRRRHRRSADKDARSDSLRLFAPDAAGAGGASSSSGPQSAEFLYLGTLVTPRALSGEVAGPPPPPPPADGAGDGSPYQKMGSPELRPLPPLPRRNADVGRGGSPEEEFFYSPGGSSGPASGPRRSHGAVAMEKCGSLSPTRSSASNPSSNAASSPSLSSITASSGSLEPSGSKNLRSPRSIGEFARNPFAVGPPQRAAPLPPPPPPPPPAGYCDSQFLRMPARQPPVLLPPRPIGGRNSPAAVYPSELHDNLYAAEKSEEKPRPKLKPLHWDKVRTSSDRSMVWDHLKSSSSFKLDEEMIESLFVSNTTNTASKDTAWRSVSPLSQANWVLDPKKSQNVAILLRALNVSKEEVCEALLEGDADRLGIELLETLIRMAPSKEEELKLKEYKDDSPFKLGPAEKFLKTLLDIPYAFKRIDAMLYIANFKMEVKHIKNLFSTLEAACGELRSSRLFCKLLEAVLKTGNRMNVGTNRGGAHAFKLDTLLKLVDVKGADGKTTLLHFVVQEIIKAEGSRLSSVKPLAAKTQKNIDDLECKKLGLQAIAGLGLELSNVKKAAAMDLDVLSSYVSKLAGGIGKVQEVMRLNDSFSPKGSCQRFLDAMSAFLQRAEDEILRIQAQENITLSLVKEITEYFHGDSAKEEAHPFRIFQIVRDFLTILDQVCKEVGRVNECAFVSATHQQHVPMNPSLSPVFPRLHAARSGSSDDESSSSSLEHSID